MFAALRPARVLGIPRIAGGPGTVLVVPGRCWGALRGVWGSGGIGVGEVLAGVGALSQACMGVQGSVGSPRPGWAGC